MTRACTPSRSGDNRGPGTLKNLWIREFEEFFGEMLDDSRPVGSHAVRRVTAQDNLLSSIPVLRLALSIVDLGNAIVHSSCKLDWKIF
jgi:hypothetical protein